MTLDHPYPQRQGPRLGAKDVQERPPVSFRYVNAREIVVPLVVTVIDRVRAAAFDIDDLAKRRETRRGQRLGIKRNAGKDSHAPVTQALRTAAQIWLPWAARFRIARSGGSPTPQWADRE